MSIFSNDFGVTINILNEPIKINNNSNEELLLKDVVETIENYTHKAYKLINQHTKINYNSLSYEEKKHHNSINKCSECNKCFIGKNKKVIHHDHITGKYINSICNECNLQYKIKKFVPVYCHNLKNYDSHFLITGLASYGFKNEEEDIISTIPNNEEKYISFSKKY